MAEVEFAAKLFHRMSLRTVADQQQFGRNFFIDLFKNQNHVLDPFYFPEIGRVGKDALAVGGDGSFEMVFVNFFKTIKINEVINHPNIFFDIEKIKGLLTQAF